VRALQDVSLTLEAGSFLTIIGMNGSGKSTLLNAVRGDISRRLWHRHARRPVPHEMAGTSAIGS
jgi:ABC-type hemin transport system ATPase subunit